VRLKKEDRTFVSSEPKKKQRFRIGDESVILRIIRGKLYSDPIRIIVQEYASNARDAHREVGKADVPIEIKLPNRMESTLEIRDWGPGISPERMDEIFTQYGKSTKRDSDEQTGGFGIGAKCAWAYTDQFSITTTVDGVKYFYIATLDEQSDGALLLQHQAETDEPNGTSILVPVKHMDFREFEKNAFWVTQYWDPRPTIKNSQSYSYNEPEKSEILLEHEHFTLFNTRNYYGGGDQYAILDGIPYKLTQNSIADLTQEQKQCFNYRFNLKFSINDVTVSANREALFYDAHTQKTIRDALDFILQKIKEQAEEILSNAKSYWEALEIFAYLKNSFIYQYTLPKADWRGVKIEDFNISIPYSSEWKTIVHATNYREWESELDGGGKEKFEKLKLTEVSHGITPNRYSSLPITASTLFVLNDTGKEKPCRRRLRTLLHEHKKDDIFPDIYIFTFYKAKPGQKDKKRWQEVEFELGETKETKKWKKNVNFSLLNATKLSTVAPTNIRRKSGKSGTNKSTVEAFSVSKIHRINSNTVDRSPVKVNLKEVTGYYILYQEKTFLLGTGIDDSYKYGAARSLKAHLDFMEIDWTKTGIYVFPIRSKKRAVESKLKSLDLAVRRKIKTFDMTEIAKFQQISKGKIESHDFPNCLRTLSPRFEEIEDKESSIFKALKSYRTVLAGERREEPQGYSLYKLRSSAFPKLPDLKKDDVDEITEVRALIRSFTHTFPLLYSRYDSYESRSTAFVSDAILYINLKNKLLREEEERKKKAGGND